MRSGIAYIQLVAYHLSPLPPSFAIIPSSFSLALALECPLMPPSLFDAR